MLDADEGFGQYKIFDIPVLKTKKMIMHELEKPCSRFIFNIRSIPSNFRTAKFMERFDPFAEQELLLVTNTPANWQAFLRFLNERGVTSSEVIFSLLIRHGMPPIFTASLNAGAHKEENHGEEVNPYGFGASYSSAEEAASKAFGELLERHFSATYNTRALKTASYEALKGKAYGPAPLDIFSLNAFLSWQEKSFPRFKRDGKKPLAWVVGKNMTSNKAAYLPAQLVFWNYRRNDEMFLYECNTNGVAGHFTREEALLGALLELIQRDGFLIHWLKIRQPRRIDHATIADAETIELLASLKRASMEVHLLDITTDIGIPTCLCVLVDTRKGRNDIYIASSSGFGERDTILSSMLEAIVVYHAQLLSEGPLVIDEPYEPFIGPIGHLDRLRVWRTKKMFERFMPFVGGTFESARDFLHGMGEYDTVASKLCFVQERLRALGEGYDIYTYDYEAPLLREVGFHVVRAIVPKIMGLYLYENSASLAAERLTSVPPKLGLEVREDLNPWPHPFP